MDTGSKRINPLFKLADRYFGIPLVFILGTFKRKKNIPKDIKNIALLKTAGIGDTILVSAIIDDICKHYPQAHICLFVSQSNQEMALILAQKNTQLSVTTLPIKNPIAAIRLLRQQHFDCWLDFGPWPRLNAIFSYFAKADFTVGFKTPSQHRHKVYNHAITHQTTQHEIENYRAIVRTALPVAFDNLPNLESYFSAKLNQKKPTIVLHMFPGGAKKQLKSLPISTWVTLANKLITDGYHLALSGDAKDKEASITMRAQCSDPDAIAILAGEHNLVDLAPLLLASQLVISVDTGLMHFASVLQCNVLSIHGPTDPKRWGGLGRNTQSFYPKPTCAPCLQLGFESSCTNNLCLNTIQADQIYALATDILATEKDMQDRP